MGDLNELIKRTQEVLQPLIAKPKLAEKLLQKPPFRFLHDIFAAVTASTGFAKGLYTDFELDSANVKEKHQKLQFLDKMIYFTGQCHGKEIDVRSAKIVAGLEPENTNIFLTELALAASNSSLDWNGAVQKTQVAYPPLAETLAGSGGGGGAAAADAKQLPSEDKPSTAKETTAAVAPPARDEAKEAEEKAKADERAARDKARRAKEEREKEAAATAQASASSEPKPPSSESSSRPSSNSKATRNENNDAGGEYAAQVRECNGDVERTKEMVETIISKPKMSAKLLSKPPFRFLHDIVSEVTRSTGFADGLYAGDELDSNAIKEKQPKIDYLQKILHCVGCQLNVEVDAKPAKIVAGLEPDDTNKFLQLLVIAAKAGNSAAAVQRVLAGDTAPRAPSAESKAKRPSVVAKNPAPQDEPPAKSSETKQAAKVDSTGPVKAMAVTAQDDDGDLASDAKSAGNEDDSSAKPGTANRTARPTTARRRPPKLKENVKEVGRLVRDDKVTPTVGIMKDGDNADSDDDTLDAAEKGTNPHRDNMLQHDDTTHGKLIRDILKDQSVAADDDEEANRKSKEDEDAKGNDSGIRLGKRRKSFKEKTKGGTSTAAEINDLRVSIQKICQATNPVGKCIEYVYEDMEAMARELDVWKKEYEKKCDVLEDEKKKSEDALQPLSAQLVEVDEQIKEQVHKINTLKATIAKNEDKMLKLLRMVVTA
ncbi:hypothetical protein H257_11768 [Aphanomyces astaci]|uniref:TRAF3-interacting protein 1 n=1 Tax=Aphanomyces astaci TaxID=112090 RepID=W4G1T5_APHAT|nr:hypothetical protein H257_11768 [Aphanomyces astaci]ETV73667.1 hypothetical protein H257_11768 [Aphanomyces astaci]|eukprot:XP_009837093.1 hypothetical protein H257_11768 [Aphanomyces astaci]